MTNLPQSCHAYPHQDKCTISRSDAVSRLSICHRQQIETGARPAPPARVAKLEAIEHAECAVHRGLPVVNGRQLQECFDQIAQEKGKSLNTTRRTKHKFASSCHIKNILAHLFHLAGIDY